MSAQSFLKVASQTWSIALWSDELGAVVAEFEELLDEARKKSNLKTNKRRSQVKFDAVQ